jgi:hypothetical protein
MATINFSKPELILAPLDQWMMRWKHYQTESDWQIEVTRQRQRQNNYLAGLAVLLSTSVWSAGRATVKRILGPPHFFEIGIDVAAKTTALNFINKQWRYTPMGYGRLVVTCLPTYVVVAVLEHYREGQRLQAYLKQETVFGEQARRYVNTGKIEEFVGPRINATA